MNLNKSLSIIAFCIGTLVIVGIIGQWNQIVTAIKIMEYPMLKVFSVFALSCAFIGYIAVIYFLVKGGKNVEK